MGMLFVVLVPTLCVGGGLWLALYVTRRKPEERGFPIEPADRRE